MDAGERLKTLARNESQKDPERATSITSPARESIMSIAAGKRATESGFMVSPQRSSISLRERRAISHTIGGDSTDEIGTAKSLRKFSSSSGPPIFGEDIQRLREEHVRRNGSLLRDVESTEDESEESDDEGEGKSGGGGEDVTPRPSKLKPLDVVGPGIQT
jgi:hypothetical protein